MKKYFALTLAFFMAVISLNAGIAMHFCRGELAEMKLVLGHGQATCGMEIPEGRDRTQTQVEAEPCCEDQLQQIKIDNAQTPYHSGLLAQTFSLVGGLVSVAWLEARIPSRDIASYRSPPDINAVSLPTVQVFRI